MLLWKPGQSDFGVFLQGPTSAYFDFGGYHTVEVIEHEHGRRMPARFIEPVADPAFERGHPFVGVLCTVDVQSIWRRMRNEAF